VADVISIFIIILFLVLYLIFIVFGTVGAGEVKEVIEANENISVLNYFPAFQSYLITNVTYDGESRDIYSLIQDYSKDMSNEELRLFLRQETEKIFSKMEYCTYSRHKEIDSPVKVVFNVYIRERTNYKSLEDGMLYGEGSELGYLFVEQRLSEGDGVYLTVREKIVKSGECDGIH